MVSTLAALNDVTQPMLQRGRAEMSDFPYHFAGTVCASARADACHQQCVVSLRERESLRRQQEENQSLLARQYAGITDILRQLGAEVTQDETAQPLWNGRCAGTQQRSDGSTACARCGIRRAG